MGVIMVESVFRENRVLDGLEGVCLPPKAIQFEIASRLGASHLPASLFGPLAAANDPY
jgi:hypothetical protein